MKKIKKYTVKEFYDYVIVKDKKLTWKCPICDEECRFLNQHLQRKHNIEFKKYFKDNVDYSCSYCNKERDLNELKWDRLKVSISSLDHTECKQSYKLSMIPERYCLECGNKLKKHSLAYCSYSCSNRARHKDLDFCIKHATSIKNSYTDELREVRRQFSLENKAHLNFSSNPNKGWSKKSRKHDNKHFSLDFHKTEIANNYLSELKDIGKSYRRSFQSKAERDFILYLKDREIDFYYQYKVGNRFFDFYFPDYNLILELDGSFIHTLDPENDLLKENLAIENNYNFCRFSSDCKNYDFYFLDCNWNRGKGRCN